MARFFALYAKVAKVESQVPLRVACAAGEMVTEAAYRQPRYLGLFEKLGRYFLNKARAV